MKKLRLGLGGEAVSYCLKYDIMHCIWRDSVPFRSWYSSI